MIVFELEDASAVAETDELEELELVEEDEVFEEVDTEDAVESLVLVSCNTPLKN